MSTFCGSPLFLLVLVAITIATAHGFSSAGSPMRSPMATTLNVATEASTDFPSAMPEAVDPHDTIGVEPDALAIGINATEFLEWVGSRDDLIKKMEADFKSFSPERVEEEVNKFMMDAEGVNMYIRYLKDKEENPGKYAQQALEQELSLSNPKTLATYGAWLVGGVSFGALRREFIDPKFASGEWKAINIELPFMQKTDAAVEAASTLTSKATNMIVDGISNGYDSLDNFV
mmetsp:Transcript_5933/g.12219  ORF Transcript_5933/g.12219 Transcript_5933/m.12219 type:complete len:231 (+) Transcript_5933:78-770(+)|eukprot:CAMPEP_0197269906 /NCGR_PEP_ID=MMETSP1432-20130617/6330_1 /TAXON_ID=44447 /ORGANISM="Pseudo-nitzschia delicatissima, Strain UNC1205" /LENGTH=230 /DNA_ID=CAMNT_0042735137 /DNA_START=35 /DNA_END=727 /DNA_ORIENTATION=+